MPRFVNQLSTKSLFSKKVLLSLGALGAAASIAGLGTYATFTSTTSASQTVSSGTVAIALGSAGTATNRLTIGASGLVPGDTVQRAADLSNATGNETLASITLTTTASPSSVLDTDATQGLQMIIEKCSAAWSETGTVAPFTYTCGGTTTVVLASQAVIGSTLALTGLTAVTPGSANTDHLRVTLTLPATTSDVSCMGKTSTISYAFLGTQRTATAH
jgi:predicted ribosomally synthesized peptide with SipW-like signal peptide